ncbi:hypothetical protein EGI26_04355 [Lacihabitans sp. CCS-44]|uniref:hypothetical protein n=1 Tax=Lacihabitans sp. CCS-44 TaxID=2487331 RepID=UPI0020CBA941|nr:hypothetical protein [Lacihabitans sp. CCS-44]MCP9754394.1 hypothetical protein [Lacihabitans sp. CCS-44]
MTSLELKTRVKSKIDSIREDSLLNEILDLIEFEDGNQLVATFSQSQIDEIEISRKQIESGNFISHSDLKEKFVKWQSK